MGSDAGEIPFTLACTSPLCFLHSCCSSPSFKINRMCPSLARELPSCGSQLCNYPEQLWPQSVSLAFLLSGTDNTVEAGYSTLTPLYFLTLWAVSIFLLGSHFSSYLYSSITFEAHLLSPPHSCLSLLHLLRWGGSRPSQHGSIVGHSSKRELVFVF